MWLVVRYLNGSPQTRQGMVPIFLDFAIVMSSMADVSKIIGAGDLVDFAVNPWFHRFQNWFWIT